MPGALRRLLSAVLFWRRRPGRLTRITVWHRMTVTGTITDDATLAAFAEIWSQKIKEPRGTRTTYRYSFDLRTLRGTKYSSTRWVYHADGLTKIMDIPALGPRARVYRIPAAEQLNRLVGIAGG
jgi:hypothetical protein